MYTVSVRLNDGVFLAITQHDTLDEAFTFAAELAACGLHEFHIRDAGGSTHLKLSSPERNTKS